MLEDIGAIAELKTNGITTHSCFLFVHNLCNNFRSYGAVLLLERQPPCKKKPVIGKFQINTKHLLSTKLCVFFPISVLFCKKTSNVLFLTYAFEYGYC